MIPRSAHLPVGPSTRVLCAVALLSSGWSAAAAPTESLLDLGQGEFLRGSPLGLTGDTLTWRHDASGAELPLPLPSVQRILFGSRPVGSPQGDILVLANGDVIAGKLETLDARSARIQSPVVGSLTIPRTSLRAAKLAASDSRMVYQHSGGLDGWKSNQEAGRPVHWRGENGTIRFDGRLTESISRDVSLPAAADVSFELAWDTTPQRQAQFSLALCTQPQASDGIGDHFAFNISRSMITGQRVGGEGNDKRGVLGRVQVSTFAGNSETLRVRLVLDRPRQRLVVFLNDQQAAEWEDNQPGAPQGTALQLTGYPGMGLRLRNLKVESWNGLLHASDSKEKSGGDKDLILADDDDEMFGQILGVKRNASGEREIEIILSVDKSKPAAFPVSRIRHIAFATSGDAPPAAASGQVVLLLADGSRLSGSLTTLGPDDVRFSYFDNPPVILPVAALAGIEFSRTKDNPAGEKSTAP